MSGRPGALAGGGPSLSRAHESGSEGCAREGGKNELRDLVSLASEDLDQEPGRNMNIVPLRAKAPGGNGGVVPWVPGQTNQCSACSIKIDNPGHLPTSSVSGRPDDRLAVADARPSPSRSSGTPTKRR